MEKYKSVKYRYFFMSFSISFLVLSVMFLFLMNLVHPKTPASLTAEPDPDAKAMSYVPSSEDALSVLFIGCTTEESAAGTFILAKFNPAGGKVPIIVFPPQTAVNNAGKTESLSEVYRYGGADYTRNALSETLGIPIDRYVRMRMDSFIAAAAAVGTVEFNLPEKITIERSGAEVTLSAGKQLLDGQKVAAIMRNENYPGGELERCRIAGELTGAIVDQRMDICLSTVVDNVFEKLINLITTDISYPDYYSRKPAAEFLARLRQNPAEAIPVSGEWNDDSSLYTLSDTFLALLTQTLE